MARYRLDTDYRTIYGRLSTIVKFEWLEALYRRVWPSTGTMDESASYFAKLRGAFQPLTDMWKDVKDTIKPYRTKSAILNDFLQPIYGIGNLLKGCIYLAAIVPLFLFLAGYNAHDAKDFSNLRFRLKIIALRSFAWFIDGVLSIVRGATQLATTPLTWFIKMPLRGIITGATDKKDLFVDRKKTMKDLVEIAKNSYQNKRAELIEKIHEKYENSTYSAITPETEIAVYNLFKNEKTADNAVQYLNLFQPPPEEAIVTDAPSSDEENNLLPIQ